MSHSYIVGSGLLVINTDILKEYLEYKWEIVRVILKYSFEVYKNYLRILNACFHIVCILYIVDNLVSNGIAED